jgi:4-hydroxybenzoate polyprenyltransferase
MKLDAVLRDFAFAYLPRGRISVKRSLTIGLAAFIIAFLIRASLAPWVSGLRWPFPTAAFSA